MFESYEWNVANIHCLVVWEPQSLKSAVGYKGDVSGSVKFESHS